MRRRIRHILQTGVIIGGKAHPVLHIIVRGNGVAIIFGRGDFFMVDADVIVSHIEICVGIVGYVFSVQIVPRGIHMVIRAVDGHNVPHMPLATAAVIHADTGHKIIRYADHIQKQLQRTRVPFAHGPALHQRIVRCVAIVFLC